MKVEKIIHRFIDKKEKQIYTQDLEICFILKAKTISGRGTGLSKDQALSQASSVGTGGQLRLSEPNPAFSEESRNAG